MKKIVALLLTLVLIGCAENSSPRNTNDTCSLSNPGTCITGKKADMSGYEGFTNKKHSFIEKNMDDVLRVFEEKKSGIFYFGYTDCAWCVDALPIMNKVASEQNVNIGYINISDKKAFTNKQLQKVGIHMENYITKDEEDKYELYVPMVLVVEKGNITGIHIGTFENHDAYERNLSKEEETALEKIYKDMM